MGTASRRKLASIVFGFLGFAGCVGWLLYNRIIFGDPLDFFRGNYSSGHQQQHIASEFGLPTRGNLALALRDFGQTVIDNIGLPIVIAGVLGFVAAFILLVAIPASAMQTSQVPSQVEPSASRDSTLISRAPAAEWQGRSGMAWAAVMGVLAVPFFFNVLALYAGNAIILTPEVPTGAFWVNSGATHAYFNVRYGLMLLPMAAVGGGRPCSARRGGASPRLDEAARWA